MRANWKARSLLL